MSKVSLICFSTVFCLYTQARSPLRPQDPLIPEIMTHWVGDTKTYSLRDHHLEEHALFTKFNKQYFDEHLLPQHAIQYRNSTNKVDGQTLQKLADTLIDELYAHKKEYTHFKMLKSEEFNHAKVSGTAIFKYKKYPFVFKLFIKTPETFVQPYSEGWIPSCFFVMGGGINPYLSGFTRLKNLDYINTKVQNDPYWAVTLDTPRKWFLLPRKNRWFTLIGKNIGNKRFQSINLPSIYGVIADAIDSDRTLNFFNDNEKKLALHCADFLENRIDASLHNFMIEKGTNKIVLIDTEHFPTKVGLKEPLKYKSFAAWYSKLAWKCLVSRIGNHKKYRRELQTKPTPALLTY